MARTKPDGLVFQDPVRDGIHGMMRVGLLKNLSLLGYSIGNEALLADLFLPDDQAALQRAWELGLQRTVDPTVHATFCQHNFSFRLSLVGNVPLPQILYIGNGENATHTFVRDVTDVVLSWRRMHQTFVILNQQPGFKPSTITYYLPWLLRMARPDWSELHDRDPHKVALARMQVKPSAIIGLSREQRQYLTMLDDAHTRYELLRQARRETTAPPGGAIPQVDAYSQITKAVFDCPFLRDARFVVTGALGIERIADAYYGE